MGRRWSFLAVVLLAGCSRPAAPVPQAEPPKEVSTDFKRLKSVLEGLRKPEAIAVYPGLPSEFWEPQLREVEASRNRTVRLQGYLFYDDRLELKGEVADRLASVLTAERSFQRRRAAKKCGGYDPDYCIEWRSDGATTYILVCLECGEVKLFGPRAELYCDLSAESGQDLERWLKPFRKYQPPGSG
ncbi:hypothetical protein OJF2_31780 [Aquisphaera giovannonii]|uniref:Uncharacterized protein n=1 Tax=Aquisphaera giovannonii TaxID=406548 RepID=A0A5B9W310_9BACT|nr:hypothetical protein [Aquisphaera giovannonii]QEH34637.1 hypothetical protein OJF2_31780 [Aquisphaera giovannonii]